jgi:thiosulfate dehydrogenase [quinone] large subunit
MGLLTEEPTPEPGFPGPDAETGVAAYSEAGRAPFAGPPDTPESPAPAAVAGQASPARRWFYARVDAPDASGAPGSPSWPATTLGTQRLRLTDWLYRSQGASVLWLLVRLWLGYQWLNAGYQKIWGAEKSAFWFGNGIGVKGFATAGVAGSATGKSGASYGWWAAFLHNFVIPNASWIGKFIALGEVAIGIALILGLFTGVAAFAGLSLNVIYMFTGSAGVNPMYGILSVLLILAWRNAGWFGVDRFVLPGLWTRIVTLNGHLGRRPVGVPSAPVVVPTH